MQITKAKVQAVTPVISVIQGASVPVKASSMPRSVMVLLYMFLGVIVDAVWILYIRDIVNKRKLKKG